MVVSTIVLFLTNPNSVGYRGSTLSSFKLTPKGTPENANPTIFDRSELPYAVNPAPSSILLVEILDLEHSK